VEQQTGFSIFGVGIVGDESAGEWWQTAELWTAEQVVENVTEVQVVTSSRPTLKASVERNLRNRHGRT
jgi:hypothetical protein